MEGATKYGDDAMKNWFMRHWRRALSGALLLAAAWAAGQITGYQFLQALLEGAAKLIGGA